MHIALALTALSLITGVLHLVWERFHIGLYTGYEKLEGVLPVYLFATLGDIAYTLLAYLLIAGFKHDLLWVRTMGVRDLLLVACVGFAIALFVEYKALALSRWAYTEAMPMIPLLHVGFSPILQMTLLLPASFLLLKLIIKP